jgi:hypothetical protein
MFLNGSGTERTAADYPTSALGDTKSAGRALGLRLRGRERRTTEVAIVQKVSHVSNFRGLGGAKPNKSLPRIGIARCLAVLIFT